MKEFNKYVGMDVHKMKIAVAVAEAHGREVDAQTPLLAGLCPGQSY